MPLVRLQSGPPPKYLETSPQYFFLLEDCAKAKETVRVKTPHFSVDERFQKASYHRRYELLCERLVEDEVYQGACFLMSGHERGPKGHFLEPNPKLTFEKFVTALCKHVKASTK